MAKTQKSNKSKRKRGKKFRAFVEGVKHDMEATDDNENPFETHFRNVAHHKATKAREGLIDEYKKQGKIGGIIDRRFNGEKEYAATVRYAIERKRSKKASKFDIDSDEELDTQKIDLFNTCTDRYRHKTDPYELNDNFDDKFLDDEIVEKLHFGGKSIDKDEGDDFFTVKKTKQEVFNEIIAKSKMFKAARAELKDQNAEMTLEVDDEFKDLVGLLNMRSHDKPKDETHITNVSLLEVAKRKNDLETEKKKANRRRDQKLIHKAAPGIDSNYNELAVEMRHDCRVRPTQLTMTEQAQALERKAELIQKQKEKSSKRVKFAEDDEESEESDDEQGADRISD